MKWVVIFAMMIVPCLAMAVDDYAGEYEVIERTQREVPNFQAPGKHTEVSYVLVRDGHKFYAMCDATSVDKLDPSASCAFAVLRKYPCRIGQDSDRAMSNLVCKDSYGGNVYLYVSKKD